jgi:hypothetical protein
MRVIHLACGLALTMGLFLGGLSAASAQGGDATQACTPDAMRLCSEFIPDRDKVKMCMLRKRAQWSAECRAAMGGGRRERVRRVYHHPYYHSRARHYYHHHK